MKLEPTQMRRFAIVGKFWMRLSKLNTALVNVLVCWGVRSNAMRYEYLCKFIKYSPHTCKNDQINKPMVWQNIINVASYSNGSGAPNKQKSIQNNSFNGGVFSWRFLFVHLNAQKLVNFIAYGLSLTNFSQLRQHISSILILNLTIGQQDQGANYATLWV